MTAASGAGPLSTVLAAFEGGATSIGEVSRHTGWDDAFVRACVDHLVRLGRLDAEEFAIGCPDGGCGSCASGAGEGAAGCGASGPSAARSGPVLVSLRVRRPGA